MTYMAEARELWPIMTVVSCRTIFILGQVQGTSEVLCCLLVQGLGHSCLGQVARVQGSIC